MRLQTHFESENRYKKLFTAPMPCKPISGFVKHFKLTFALKSPPAEKQYYPL